jgi:hypothetical protein
MRFSVSLLEKTDAQIHYVSGRPKETLVALKWEAIFGQFEALEVRSG